MYPHVTQFQTRDRMILDDLRLREERRLLTHRASPHTRRATIRIRLAQMLKVAQESRARGVPRDRLPT